MDHDDRLRQHGEQVTLLITLHVQMVALHDRLTDAIARIDATLERLTTNLEVVTALLQRSRDDDHRNGH